MSTAAKLVITESGQPPRSEEYGSFQLAAHQFDLAMDYWANRGTVIKDKDKFTCHVAQGHWATVELVRT